MTRALYTPGPWFDWGEGVWLVEPQRLLSRYEDACLIAVAPEMADLLRRVTAHNISVKDFHREARTLLAKAQGDGQ